MEPCIRLCADSVEPAWDFFSLCPSSSSSLSLSLSQNKEINFKKEKKKRKSKKKKKKETMLPMDQVRKELGAKGSGQEGASRDPTVLGEVVEMMFFVVNGEQTNAW